ncbi:MAG: hypothetical protein D6753_06075, partial [Planctomycetota bacterium]
MQSRPFPLAEKTSAVPDPPDIPDELRLSEALAEYLHQCDLGRGPDREEFLAQHPAIRDQLAALLEAADWLEQAAEGRIADLVQEADPERTILLSQHEETAGSKPVTRAIGDGTRQAGASPASSREHGGSAWRQPTLPCKFGEYRLERI